jgi:iron complex transport system substrate-binding protein
MSKRERTVCMVAAVITAAVVIALAVVVLPRYRTSGAELPKPSGQQRIVSLSPSTTEMLFILGVGKSLVGATEYCDYPPEAKQIERVGGFGKPNIEKLLSLSPDLVVGAGLNRTDAMQVLRDSGIRVLEVRINNIDEMFQSLRQIGDAVGKRPEADKAIASMQKELKEAVAKLPDAKKTPPPRVFVELWDDPLTTIGGSSYLDDVISRAGCFNVAHEVSQAHPRISAEKIIEWNPDVIIIAHMAQRPCSAAEIGKRIGWSDIKAVKQSMVVCDIPNDLMLRPGPRLVALVKMLVARLHETPAPPAATTDKAARK